MMPGSTSVACAMRTMMFCCASSFAAASPFINITPHPELAALRPVMPPEDQPKSDTTAQESLPAVVLNFLPEDADVRKAKLHFADVWDRIRAGFRIPGLDIKEATESEAWYTARPELVTKIFERSRYYLFHIVEEIEKRGMPMELALLPFVESGFNPVGLCSA